MCWQERRRFFSALSPAPLLYALGYLPFNLSFFICKMGLIISILYGFCEDEVDPGQGMLVLGKHRVLHSQYISERNDV